MKKALVILGAIAVAAVCALFGVAFFGLSEKEKEENRDRTAPARAAKLAKAAERKEEKGEEPEKTQGDEKES